MKARAQSLILEGKENVAETVRMEIFSEQPGRSLYRTNKRDLLIQEFTAPPSSNGGKKSDQINPGIIRNRISSYLFEYLKGFHIPTHFLDPRPGAEMLVKFTDAIPLVVRVYNVAEDDWSGRFGVGIAGRLEFPVIEHYLEGPGGSAAWVNEYHLYAFNVVRPEEFRQVNRLASKANAVLRGLCERRELALAGMTLTFGRYNNAVIVTGELSHLTCRFLDTSVKGRGVEGKFAAVETGSVEALERLYGRLKLNG
jgi:phosphoribosylaminoimidazole-succinocarboxamide synthase